MTGTLSEFGPLARVVVKHARDGFVSQQMIEAQWRTLNFTAAPDYHRAIDQYDAFLEILRRNGIEIVCLPPNDAVTLDSIYTRDASVMSPQGLIGASMGKRDRESEPGVQTTELQRRGCKIAGRIAVPGHLEGGDVVWLDGRTVAVGWGYRTDADGIRQFKELLGAAIDELIVVPLPHWRGAGDVMHLMSLISPVDRDLAVVYSPLLPVPFRNQLLTRGMSLVEVPDEEFTSMGTNVLALAPRVCVMVRGNPRTRAALEHAGANVYEYDGDEISLKGGGGPTCLTRPLVRTSIT